jgi:PST family polysaccharide transporter
MSLADIAVSGAIWMFATGVGTRVVGLLGTLALTRFLAPEVYGEVQVAVILVQSVSILSLYGLLQFLIARPDAGRCASFHASFYFLALGAVALGVTVALRDWLGALFGAPGMGRYVPGLALAVGLERVAALPERLQIRAAQFRTLSLQRSFGGLVFTFATTALAWAGFGGHAIVLGSIARSAVRLAFVLPTTAWRDWIEPHPLNRANTREVIAFGAPMSIAVIAGFGSRSWDNLVFSRLFGPATAGFYNLAYNLADVPASQVSDAIGDVLTGTLGKVVAREQRRKALVRSFELLNLVVAPLVIGLAVVAPTVVGALFQPRWAPVGPMLAILSALSIVRPLGWVGNAYLQIRCQPRLVMLNEVARTVVLLAAMVLLGGLGPLWACAAVGLAFGASALGYVVAVRRVDGIPVKDMLAPLLPPLVACVPMALSVMTVRAGAMRLGHATTGATLALEILAGAVSFAVAALVLAPSASRALLGHLRSARAG